MQQALLFPLANELPSHYSQRLSKYYASNTNQEHKKKLGQFFTPLILSNFIASFSTFEKNKLKVLDPGCGTCVLSCSLIEKLSQSKKLKTIELTTYEIDPKLNVYTAAALSYLNDWLYKKNVSLKINHRSVDFISENFSVIDFPSKDRYDIIISNPPYFKISKEDERKKMFNSLSNGQLNIYAVFAAVSANMLTKKGELIFIIPRSFASGDYFKTFRNIFFSKIQIEKIHLFVSRKDAFEDYDVLQENVIIKGKRVDKVEINKTVKVSQSHNLKDIGKSEVNEFRYTELISINSEEKFLYLPNSIEQQKIMKLLKAQKNNLESMGFKISTGPIVYFRKKDFLQKERMSDSVPLYWLDNVKKLQIIHPLNGKSKEQYFRDSGNTSSVLLPNSNMVLVRRFSSKDDSNRLVAAPHIAKNLNDHKRIGVENRLNYIVKREGKLSKYQAIGIASILNSRIYDEYFKIFNGNTQVSASELKKIPFPEIKRIESIGKKVARLSTFNQEKIDSIVLKALLEKNSNG